MIHVPVRERAIGLVDFYEGRVRADQVVQLNDRWLEFFQRLGGSYGTWYAVTFAAGTFTANGSMTWTVESGDQITLAYTQMGQRVELAFTIRTSSVGGTLNTTLRITLPAGLVAARAVTVPCRVNDNGTLGPGWASVTAGGTVLSIVKEDESNWAAATNTTGVEGILTFEIQGRG